MNELRQYYLDQPHEVSLETQALCNAACEFCPYPTIERKGQRMPDELISRLVDEMAEWTVPFFFAPFKLNEPFLDKRLLPLLRRMNLDVPKAALRVFSNGSPLTEKHLDELSEVRNVAHLWISLNSHVPEEYERIMQMPFERTAKRLDMLHGRDFPHEVVVSAVGYPNEPFVRYCRERWPKFKALAFKRDAWIDFTEPNDPEVPNTPCSRWFELSIMATGKVAHCCMDSGEDDRYTIGDVSKQTMLEVYNAPFWRERRERMLSRKQLDDRSPCNRCSY